VLNGKNRRSGDGLNRSVVQARPVFLDDALRRGSSFAEVAGFLCRHEGEVREKAKELGWCEGLKSLEGQP
jgi:hypothetical protein